MATDSARLLSVQSHVVSGYVGNRSACFPLQLLAWDVDVINTVQFSNHTGYGRWQGLRFDEEHVRSLFSGLEQNGLLTQSRMLSGYMPSPGVVSAVKDAVQRIREVNPELVYLCDPVMGDMGRGMYVNPEVLPVYKSILPLTTIITPNQFEAQALAGQDITDLPSLLSVLRSLHDQGASHVLITSVELPEADLRRIGATSSSTLPDGTSVSSMVLVGSSRIKTSGEAGELTPWFIEFPEIQEYFSGVGDLFAALTLGRFQASPQSADNEDVPPIARAAELAIASVQGILARTMASPAFSAPPETPSASASLSEADARLHSRVDQMRRRELRVVQGREDIEHPVVRYRAVLLPTST